LSQDPSEAAKKKLAADYLLSSCDTFTGNGCVPWQLPMYGSDDGATNWQPSQPYTTSFDLDLIHIDPEPVAVSHVISKTSRTSQEVMNEHSSSFGLDASVDVPTEAGTLTFSGSFSYQSLTRRTHTSSSVYGYYDGYRKLQVYVARFHPPPGGVPLNPDFLDAVVSLPSIPQRGGDKPTPDELKWIQFFSRWGTHYTKTVAFGGIMKMYSIVSGDAWSNSKYDSSGWKASFDAKLDETFGMGVNGGSGNAHYDKEAYSNLDEDSSFFVVGGDECSSDWNAWVGGVKTHPAPIITTLGALHELVGPGTSFSTFKSSFANGYAAYLMVCPYSQDDSYEPSSELHPDRQQCAADGLWYACSDSNCASSRSCASNGGLHGCACEKEGKKLICGGLGACIYDPNSDSEDGKGTCECDPGSYLDDDDGLCYPKCLNDCNGRGTCKKGKCDCTQRQIYKGGAGIMSFTGEDCSKPCGRHVFYPEDHSAGSCGGALSVPFQSWMTYTSDKESDMDRWCRQKVVADYPDRRDDFDTGAMHHSDHQSKKCTMAKQDMYDSYGSKVCHMRAMHDCSFSTQITCDFGGDAECRGGCDDERWCNNAADRARVPLLVWAVFFAVSQLVLCLA
jgi:hypothetical protein